MDKIEDKSEKILNPDRIFIRKSKMIEYMNIDFFRFCCILPTELWQISRPKPIAESP
jgi:hypothetical protein